MSREIKRSKTKLEKLIMETWHDTKKTDIAQTDEQADIIKAVKETLRYFEMEDYLYNSRHVEIIKKAYLSEKYEKKNPKSKSGKRVILVTKEGLAGKFHMDARTLRNYTNTYIKCFEKNLNDTLQQE